MAARLACNGKSAIVDWVVCLEDGQLRHEVYVQNQAPNLGSFPEITRALQKACEGIGHNPNSSAQRLEVDYGVE